MSLKTKTSNSLILSLLRHRRGIAMVEFALILPLLMLLVLGTVETARLVQFHQKIEGASGQLVNLINQNLNLTQSTLNALMESTSEMILPFEVDDLQIVVSAIQQNSAIGPSDVLWQVSHNGGFMSNFAPNGAGSKVTLAQPRLLERDQVIIVEMRSIYKPIININSALMGMGIISSPIHTFDFDPVYKYSIARPRYGSFQFPPR